MKLTARKQRIGRVIYSNTMVARLPAYKSHAEFRVKQMAVGKQMMKDEA